MIWDRIKSLWKQNGTASTPNIEQDYRSASYCVLDLETTGLDPANDEIISVGMVMIDAWRIRLSSAQHRLVQASKTVDQSAIYHGIVDSELLQAESIESVLPDILEILENRFLVVHSASVDVAFLNSAIKRIYGKVLPLKVIDTMALAMRQYHLENKEIPEDGLRLHHLREHYCLPYYNGHHALSDALATAELFLAMASTIAGKKSMPVKRLLSS